MDVSGAVVANRQLTVAAISGRIMAHAPMSSSIASGGNAFVDGDDYATRVDTYAHRAANNGTVRVACSGTPLAQFNDLSQTPDLARHLPACGAYSGSIDLASALLRRRESSSVGATVQPAVLDYNVTVLDSGVSALTGSD